MAGVGWSSSTRGRNAVWGGLAAAIVAVSFPAYAGPLEDAIQGLGAVGDDEAKDAKMEASVRALAALDDPKAIATRWMRSATPACASARTGTCTSGTARTATCATR